VVQQLLDAGRKLGEGAILLPASDEWAIFVADHAELLREQFVFADVPLHAILAVTSKACLHDLAVSQGVPTPDVRVPRRHDQVHDMAREIGYPVLLKPIFSIPGRESAVLVDTPAALAESFWAMGGPGRVLLQEYLPGEEGDIWMYDGYFDQQSRCVVDFTARKVRQQPAGMGVCSLGVCEPNDEVVELSRRLLSSIGYRGVVDIDYWRDRRDGSYQLLDVNPRLGGAFRLMVDRRGLDVVRAMYLDLTGQPVPAVEPNPGRRWLLEAADLLAYRHYRRAHGLGAREWLASLSGLQEPATFSLRDPLPFLMSMWILITETTSGRWHRLASRIRARLGRHERSRPVPPTEGRRDTSGPATLTPHQPDVRPAVEDARFLLRRLVSGGRRTRFRG
jgi:predicted ATP-grasp superfamily ATP-dependent carboligase